jgi:hypothetical protein
MMAASRWDVVVVGGGAAGIAAAVSAARAGARTRLVERYGFLGGMATAGMVGTVCGLYATGPAEPPGLLNEGIAGEVARGLVARGSAPLRRGRTVVLPYVPFDVACLADELAARERSLVTSLHTTCTGVATAADRIGGLRLLGWPGVEEVEAGAVVDTSGDAIVAWLAGRATDTTPAASRQLSSLVFVLQRVADGAVGGPTTVAVLRRLAEAERAGRLPQGASHAAFRASGRPGEVVVKLALDALGQADADDLGHAERVGRARVAAVAAFLRAAVAGFAGSFVSHVAPQVGVRETRRIVGRATLGGHDVLGARKAADGVARAAWPIELWQPGAGGPRYEYVPDGDHYDVPRGCLEARDCANLFAAGRCMSATHEAMGSARVIGTCLATGEAAGRLAAERARA